MKDTYFMFPSNGKKVYLCVTRPVKFSHKDDDIGCRAFEKIVGVTKEDEWTKEMDAFFKMENITFREVTEEEFKTKMVKASEFIIRG